MAYAYVHKASSGLLKKTPRDDSAETHAQGTAVYHLCSVQNALTEILG